MILLQETASEQDVKFIGRELYSGSGYVHITDELLNTTTEYNSVTFFIDRHYTTFSLAMPVLKEDRKFVIVAGYGATELYRGNIFVTNQSNYSINNGLFTERSTTNQFIVLDE